MDILTLLLAVILAGLAVTAAGWLFGIGLILADAYRTSPRLALRILGIGAGLFFGLVLLLDGIGLGLVLLALAAYLMFQPWNYWAP